MQRKEETLDSDPLDSINAFWKVESGALVKDIRIKDASEREEQQAEPVVEFDPLTTNFPSHGKMLCGRLECMCFIYNGVLV